MQSELQLDAASTALLLIDLQEEQRSDPLYKASGTDTVLRNAAHLLNAARARGITVIHAAYRRDYAAVPPRPFEPRGPDGAAVFSSKDDPATAICAEVIPVAGETVISKNDASAFSEPALDLELKSRRIEWLVIAGVWTEACIAATVRDGIARGYRILLVKDACGSGSDFMHKVAVLNLANRLYGGAIADTARAIALLRGSSALVWRTRRPVPLLFNAEDFARHYDSL